MATGPSLKLRCALIAAIRQGGLPLRFGLGSQFAHLSEWRLLAERIVVALERAGFEAGPPTPPRLRLRSAGGLHVVVHSSGLADPAG